MKRLTQNEVLLYQKRGCFDEHLITLNAQVYGDPYVFEDAFLVYHDPMSETLWLTLFELKGSINHPSRLECLKASIAEFEPRKVTVASPEKLESTIGDYCCKNMFFDKDYQVKLDEFDENLRGGAYECLRCRVNNALKRGYTLNEGKELTPAHSYVMASHISKRQYHLWDLQLFLRLHKYVEKSTTAKLFNVALNGLLIGFDVVDFMGNTMTTPLGFYLDYPSLADFMMHKEILYAKKQGFEWLDIGWACSPGLEEFKKKWRGTPKFSIYVHEYLNTERDEKQEKSPVQIMR